MGSPEGKTIAARVILGVIGVFLIAIGLGVGTYKYANRAKAPVEAAANAPLATPAPTPTAPVQQPQADTQQPEAQDAQETRDNLEKFRSSPDPHPPVAPDKIQGVWWSEDNDEHKAYAFVEKEDASATPLKAILTMNNGAGLVIHCLNHHPPLHHGGDDLVENCDVLPPFTWVRVAITGVDRDPETSGWGMTYRSNDDSDVSVYLVKSVCYPSGYCTNSDEEGAKLLKKMRDKAITGSD